MSKTNLGPKDPHQELGERIVGLLGASLKEELNDMSSGTPMGFALFIFDFGAEGFVSYCSNGERGDVAKILRNHLSNLEKTS